MLQFSLYGLEVSVMSNQLASIIIPMYNAEKTITACLISIQHQTYEQIEMIVMDDGSTDNSAIIVKKMQQQDKRIQLFSQQNQGVSTARNQGILHATGTFIQFVDADDWIDQTMTAQLIEKMKPDVDLAICGYETAKIKIHPHQTGIYDREDWLSDIGTLYEQTLLQSPCNKIYRRKLMQTKDIQFPHDISIGEDFLFNLTYLTYTKKIALLSTTLYNYCEESDSLTRTYHANLFAIQKQLYNEWKKFLIKNDSNTKTNEQAGANVFIQGTAFSMNNLYTTSFTNESTRYHILKNIVHDETVAQTAKTTNGYLAFFLRHKQIKLIHLLYKVKKIIRR